MNMAALLVMSPRMMPTTTLMTPRMTRKMLGSAVAETLARTCPAPAEFVGMRDAFGKSGEFDELMAYFNLDAGAIVEAVKKVMARKQV